MSSDSLEATRREQTTYDRQSRWYDLSQWPMEVLGLGGLRRRLWEAAEGRSVLEVGVGTGLNVSHYPDGARVVAVDLSSGMLRRAVRRAARLRREVDFLLADAEHLPFRDGVFDAVTATFVFCSVPDPVRGLRELRRVCSGEGRTLLLEHVRASNPVLGKVMDWLNPLTVRLQGVNINRDTVGNVRSAGFAISREESFRMNIVKLLCALPGAVRSQQAPEAD